MYRLKDGITFERFRNAWDATVTAHTILRTRVVQLDSQGAMQVVLRQGIECQRGTNLKQYLVDDCEKETPLGAPLARAGLIKGEEPTSPAYSVITFCHDTTASDVCLDPPKLFQSRYYLCPLCDNVAFR